MPTRIFSTKYLLTPILVAMLVIFGSFQSLLAGVTPVKLQCEDRTNPVGMDVVNPQLSWILSSGQRDEKQTAYQIGRAHV